jgi:SAM-dependent methyltransferase
MLDPLACYELCVQSPRHVAAFLRGLHGNEPAVLAEDFCGTAAVSRRWVADAARLGVDGRSVGIDLDQSTLQYAASRAREEGVGESITLLRGDLVDLVNGPIALRAEECHRADLIFVGNFSIGYIHDRATLIAYLTACKRRLDAANHGFGSGGHGAFVCDLYGGAGAFLLGGLERKHPGRGREIIRYSWRHEAADPITARVRNSISFRVEVDGEVVTEWPRAFVYEWRLWGLAELREAMVEAGFARVELYKDVNVAPGERPTPIAGPEDLGEDWIVLVAARV